MSGLPGLSNQARDRSLVIAHSWGRLWTGMASASPITSVGLYMDRSPRPDARAKDIRRAFSYKDDLYDEAVLQSGVLPEGIEHDREIRAVLIGMGVISGSQHILAPRRQRK
jgi:hypothetical protein